MDIEWAKDGKDKKIYILQARPETVQSKVSNYFERYTLKEKGELIVAVRVLAKNWNWDSKSS